MEMPRETEIWATYDPGGMTNGRPPVRHRRLLSLLLAAAVVVVAATALVAEGRHPDPHRLLVLALLEGVVVVAWIAESVRHHLLLPALMGVVGILAMALGNDPVAAFGLLAALASAGSRLAPASGIALALPMVAVFELVERSRGRQLLPLADEIFVLATTVVVAGCLRRLRLERNQEQAAVAELEQLRKVEDRAARVAERVRLANEMHEALGETLSELREELESAQLLLLETATESPTGRALERARRLARQASEEARRAAGTLRGDRRPGAALLAALLSEFERESGTEARLRVEGEPVELAPEGRLALYRTLQEALANAGRNGRAGQVEVRLRYQPAGAELSVDAQAAGGTVAGPAGFPAESGLAGLRRRVELVGGKLEAGASQGGPRLRLWLPAGAGANAPRRWSGTLAGTVWAADGAVGKEN